MQPVEGGWSGETFLAEAGGERSVVRIFADPRHGPHAAEVQESVLRLVRGLVPVPAVLDARHADAATGMPAMLVTEHLPGVRGDLLLPRLAPPQREALGRAVGAVAADLAAMPQLRAGRFVDGDLRVAPGAEDLPTRVDRQTEALAATGWSAAEVDALRAVADEVEAELESVGRTSLVHGDLTLADLLLDEATLSVTGVVDWERAHAGHPFTDLGSLLRLHRDPAYVAGVLEAWRQRHGTDPEAALDLARQADLPALVDLAVRAGEHPAADAAAGLLRAIAATGDVHAVAT
nr:phosphotransferase [Nocardioides sp. zg-DK7169]